MLFKQKREEGGKISMKNKAMQSKYIIYIVIIILIVIFI